MILDVDADIVLFAWKTFIDGPMKGEGEMGILKGVREWKIRRKGNAILCCKRDSE